MSEKEKVKTEIGFKFPDNYTEEDIKDFFKIMENLTKCVDKNAKTTYKKIDKAEYEKLYNK